MADAQCVQCGQPREAHGRTNFELFGCGVFCVDDDLGQPPAATCKHSCERDALKEQIYVLRHALNRARNVLNNMARENEGAIFFRWPISHEPLRADARNLLPIIDEALSE